MDRTGSISPHNRGSLFPRPSRVSGVAAISRDNPRRLGSEQCTRGESPTSPLSRAQHSWLHLYIRADGHNHIQVSGTENPDTTAPGQWLGRVSQFGADVSVIDTLYICACRPPICTNRSGGAGCSRGLVLVAFDMTEQCGDRCRGNARDA